MVSTDPLSIHVVSPNGHQRPAKLFSSLLWQVRWGVRAGV